MPTGSLTRLAFLADTEKSARPPHPLPGRPGGLTVPAYPRYRATIGPGPCARIGPTALYGLRHAATADAAFVGAWAQFLVTPRPAVWVWWTVRGHVRVLVAPACLGLVARLEPGCQDALLFCLVLALAIDRIAGP